MFVGAVIPLDFVWGMTDFAIGAMTLMNLFILCAMSGEVKKETERYFSKGAKKGLMSNDAGRRRS